MPRFEFIGIFRYWIKTVLIFYSKVFNIIQQFLGIFSYFFVFDDTVYYMYIKLTFFMILPAIFQNSNRYMT